MFIIYKKTLSISYRRLLFFKSEKNSPPMIQNIALVGSISLTLIFKRNPKSNFRSKRLWMNMSFFSPLKWNFFDVAWGSNVASHEGSCSSGRACSSWGFDSISSCPVSVNHLLGLFPLFLPLIWRFMHLPEHDTLRGAKFFTNDL